MATNTVIMVRPQYFGFNQETAATNSYQHEESTLQRNTAASVAQMAMSEWESAVQSLRAAGVGVLELDSPVGTPDAVFPNNWCSLHAVGEAGDDSNRYRMVVYPMLAENRRRERQPEAVVAAMAAVDKQVVEVIDLRLWEQEGKYLEGTGVCVFDMPAQKVYVGLSSRAHLEPAQDLAARLGLTLYTFTTDVYHANFMFTLLPGLAVLAPEHFSHMEEYEGIAQAIVADGRGILEIDPRQVSDYCGNLLGLVNLGGENLIAISEVAVKNFNGEQLSRLQQAGRLVPLRINSIETVGGGSARCLLLEA